MGHNIALVDNEPAMMYVGQVPWHGLGTQLEREVNSETALRMARLDWNVARVPLFAQSGEEWIKAPGGFGIVREDLLGTPECQVLGVVGKDYVPFQNAEAFAFFDQIIGGTRSVYHTAGALGHGERIWALAKMPGNIELDDDTVEKYLLLTTGHDGRTALTIRPTGVRVVCQNTLNLAMGLRGESYVVAHTRGFHDRLELVRASLARITMLFSDMGTTLRRMQQTTLDDAGLNTYMANVFPIPEDADERYAARMEGDRRRAMEYARTGKGNTAPKTRGTLWAAFNGVTDYVDHVRGHFSRNQRLNSIWFGRGNEAKTRAYDVAAKWVGAMG